MDMEANQAPSLLDEYTQTIISAASSSHTHIQFLVITLIYGLAFFAAYKYDKALAQLAIFRQIMLTR